MIPCSADQESDPVTVTVCESTLDVDEATAGLEIRPMQYCLPSRVTGILMNPAILELHAIRQVSKHRQLHHRVCGVSSAGRERIFEVLVGSGAQVSLVRKGLRSSQFLRRSASPVTRRVDNVEIMEGGLDQAEISLEFIRHEQLSRTDHGHKHQIKGLFYEADLPEWDMIMGFDFLDIAHAGVLRHRRTLLVKKADKLSWLSTSMEPQASPWEPAEPDFLAQAVRSVSTGPPTADIEDEYSLSGGAFHMALGELLLSSPQMDMFGSAALWKFPRVWTKGGNRWKCGLSSDLWDPLYIHAPRGSLEHVVAKIARDRARAFVTIPSWEIQDAKGAPWVQHVRCMAVMDTQLPSAEDIFVDAQGRPLPSPPKGWTTTVAYVDGSLALPDRDMGMLSITAKMRPEGCTLVDRPDRGISRIMALPVRYGEETADGWYCPARDALSADELDMTTDPNNLKTLARLRVVSHHLFVFLKCMSKVENTLFVSVVSGHPSHINLTAFPKLFILHPIKSRMNVLWVTTKFCEANLLVNIVNIAFKNPQY